MTCAVPLEAVDASRLRDAMRRQSVRAERLLQAMEESSHGDSAP